ncbi:hypothetical protein BU25DRAFT_465380 [Macroventuria anomochaeta]|uniref:Uncharacterized protein n=1 Tax=Macroventuria anomochaeta TaxID=301207 RepID=A0ACB6S5K3_9PLEO|nr:uncharacterized protein BU25DRAFT_465380 [Macroventuria anomochaeta]KAF2629267.1 hypothetical protein BU25DRAFT_465380 [Macroventuria anomochaeta]
MYTVGGPLANTATDRWRTGLNTTTQAWATVPNELQGRAAYHGVFQNGTVFLGGSHPVFKEGITLVHEVGHWFGLYHTFANGCCGYSDRRPAAWPGRMRGSKMWQRGPMV